MYVDQQPEPAPGKSGSLKVYHTAKRMHEERPELSPTKTLDISEDFDPQKELQ